MWSILCCKSFVVVTCGHVYGSWSVLFSLGYCNPLVIPLVVTCGHLSLSMVVCDRWSFVWSYMFVVIHIHVVNPCHLWKLVIICARFYQSSSVRVSAPCSYGQSISFLFTYGFLWSFVVMYDTLWSVVVHGHSRSYPQHLCSILSVCVHS